MMNYIIIHHNKYAHKFFEEIFIKQTYICTNQKTIQLKENILWNVVFFFQLVMYMIWNIVSTCGPVYEIHA